jgi:PDZ domain-containing protein
LHARPGCIGVDLTQLYSIVHQPFPVNLNAEGIIGPSAGLAFTLGLMKALDPAEMTAGLKIAATGTISLDGSIGDVGGVAQKTISVRNSGAAVFFVPKVEYQLAKANAGGHLRIFPVSTIAQVIHDLEGLGGRIVKEYPR